VGGGAFGPIWFGPLLKFYFLSSKYFGITGSLNLFKFQI